MKNEKPNNPIDYEVVEENPWMDEGGAGSNSPTDADDEKQARRLCYAIAAIIVVVVAAIILAVV